MVYVSRGEDGSAAAGEVATHGQHMYFDAEE